MSTNDANPHAPADVRRRDDGDHPDAGRRHTATRVRRDVRSRRRAARGRRAARDGARQRQPVGDARAGLGKHPRRGRQPRARPARLRPRDRLARELREPEAAGQPARQGVPDSPARRPHGRHDHAVRQLREGRTCGRSGQGLGSERDRASSGHEVVLRRDRDGTRLGHRGREGRDQRGQHADRGARVRLEPDRGGVRGQRRDGDVVPGRSRADRRCRLPPRLRGALVLLLGRHVCGLAARARERRRPRPAHPRVLPAGCSARGRFGPVDRAGDDRTERRAHITDGSRARCSAW